MMRQAAADERAPTMGREAAASGADATERPPPPILARLAAAVGDPAGLRRVLHDNATALYRPATPPA
ncbi:hypothetical protein [Thiococcus pfennigii]|uniref:hypothetical protein n=1 Tax=Thiococcus pfennigii TaxID=1057 RepID=UPI001906E6B5|nr:hypothetical protein [Thiococcus pfennigii]